jgi:voltage-gated potassium channel
MRILRIYMSLLRAMWRALGTDQVKPLFTLVLLLAAFGAVVFRTLEGWSFMDGLYFSFVTMATVGYGDLTPATWLGKAAAIMFMFAGIGVFVLAMSTFAQAFLREIMIAEGERRPPPDGDETKEDETMPWRDVAHPDRKP